jgi:hypothetical protein
MVLFSFGVFDMGRMLAWANFGVHTRVVLFSATVLKAGVHGGSQEIEEF